MDGCCGFYCICSNVMLETRFRDEKETKTYSVLYIHLRIHSSPILLVKYLCWVSKNIVVLYRQDIHICKIMLILTLNHLILTRGDSMGMPPRPPPPNDMYVKFLLTINVLH